LVQGIRMENGQMLLDGYPDGAVVHGIEGPNAKELRRLSVFEAELHKVVGWLKLIPVDLAQINMDESLVFEGLADAALLAFCRCFDSDHPLRPLRQKGMLSLAQRDQLERIRAVRNKLVAHDEQLFNGTFSLIVRSRDFAAIEAVSLNLLTPFVALSELNDLRSLSGVVQNWVKNEHERVATEIVRTYDASPLAERVGAPPCTINVESKDHFAPKKNSGAR
jgi:hypothetical protein